MEQLNGLDTSLLNIETPTVHSHVGWLAIFEGSESMTFDAVRATVADRLDELEPFRRRLLPVPFGLDRPYWIEDGDFDLDFHVRHIAVPPPGASEQLADLVARLHGRPLDRAKPLWELYVIEGLEGGAVALYTKIHHACVDGVTGVEVHTTLLDVEPGIRPAKAQPVPWTPDRIPSTTEMLARGLTALVTQPALQVRLQRRLFTAGAQQTRRQIPPAVATLREALRRTPLVSVLVPESDEPLDYLSSPALSAPRLSFNRSISPHRRYAYGSIPLDDVKEIKDRFGVTVNDVVMAICAGGLRTWLHRRHELPTDPLLVMVPVSIRGQDGGGERDSSTGNRLSAMIAALPTNEAKPLERLRLAHQAMEVAKTDHAALPADLLQDFGRFAPPAVAARVARLVARTRLADLANPPFNLVISNIPGPQHPVYCAGARQLAAYPLPVVTDAAGLNITLSSYDGSLDFGLLACREAIDDVASLMGDITAAADELYRAVVSSTEPATKKASTKSTKKPSSKNTKKPSSKSTKKTSSKNTKKPSTKNTKKTTAKATTRPTKQTRKRRPPSPSGPGKADQ